MQREKSLIQELYSMVPSVKINPKSSDRCNSPARFWSQRPEKIFEFIFSKEIYVYLIFMLLKGQNHEKDPANKLDVHKSCIVKVIIT